VNEEVLGVLTGDGRREMNVVIGDTVRKKEEGK
jgi:hypothetical protein